MLTGLMRENPMAAIQQPKVPQRVRRVLTIAEVERLIHAAKTPFERAVIEMLYATGARVTELTRIRLEDVDWPQRSIRIVAGKGGKDRIVLFGSFAETAIRAYQEKRKPTSGLLFESPQSNASAEPVYSPVAIRNVVRRAAHSAGLGPISPHMLRRAMATHMLQSGADLRVIQELLGHSLVTTTALYTSHSPENLLRIHAKYFPFADANQKEEPDATETAEPAQAGSFTARA
ncbi:MAG: tyrosine-type recombinase/integrase [Candidatus Acidiferrales bacterium]